MSIGDHIRQIRLIRGYTIDDLADAIADVSDRVYTANAIGAWERGERHPNSQVLIHIAKALDCSIYSLLYGQLETVGRRQRIFSEVDSLNSRNIQTLLYIASRWMGNKQPLIEFGRGYAMLPKRLRCKLVQEYLFLYAQAKRNHELCGDLPVDIEVLKDGLQKLRRDSR